MTRNIEEKMVFGISPQGDGDGVPIVILGIPRGAWRFMRDGKTHTFDLRAAGISIKIIAFGAKDHTEAMKLLEAGSKAAGQPILDVRNRDFSIKPKTPPSDHRS